MKVICIDGNWNKGGLPMSTGPKETEIVTVTEATFFINKPFYRLLEYSPNDIFWEQENFAPLSDIDEKEYFKQVDKIVLGYAN